MTRRSEHPEDSRRRPKPERYEPSREERTMPKEVLRQKLEQLEATAERYYNEAEKFRREYLAIHTPEMRLRPENDPERMRWEQLGSAIAETEQIRVGLIHQASVLVQLYRERFNEEYPPGTGKYFSGR